MHLLSSLRTFIHFILSVWNSVSFFLSFFCIFGYNSLLLCIFYCSKKCCPLGLGSCVFFKKIFIYLSGCSRSRLQHSGSPCITQHLLSWQMDSLVDGTWAAERTGFRRCRTQVLWLWRAGGLSSSATRVILAPQPGIEPVSPELQGRFLTTGPQGDPGSCVFLI